MDGHGSDLRTGLPWQMVEIHEPVRLVTVIETEPAVLERLMTAHSGFGQLAKNRWIQLVAWSPSTGEMSVLTDQGFRPYEPETTKLKTFPTSRECYGGHREHLPWARIEAGCRLGAAS